MSSCVGLHNYFKATLLSSDRQMTVIMWQTLPPSWGSVVAQLDSCCVYPHGTVFMPCISVATIHMTN